MLDVRGNIGDHSFLQRNLLETYVEMSHSLRCICDEKIGALFIFAWTLMIQLQDIRVGVCRVLL